MKKEGLFYLDGSYRTRQEVRTKLAFEEATQIKHLTDFPPERDFERWTEVVSRRQKEKQELLGIPEQVEVEIRTNRPILVALFGDVHAGGEEVDYNRFAKDVDLVRKVEGYTITVGDLTESGFFMPIVDEHILSGEEQRIYMKAALGRLAEGDRLIAGFGGDHGAWVKDKMGVYGLYQDFHKQYHAHYLEGVSYITIGLNNGENVVNYKLVGSHQHKGYSWFHSSHSAIRQEMEARGADVSFTAHKHEKGYMRKLVKQFGGDEKKIDCIALGTYKTTDRYSRKHGWPRKDKKEMGAFGIVLSPGKKEVNIFWNLEQAIDFMGK